MSSRANIEEKSKNGKIYLLRHEQRDGPSIFDTPLSPLGHKRANESLCTELESLSIDIIYSSPFLRTIQTIKPFCEKTGLTINLEWSLVESFPQEPITFAEAESIINHDYVSFYEPRSFDFNNSIPNRSEIKKRIETFVQTLDYLKNILLVTHLPVINTLLNNQTFSYIAPGSIHLFNR